MRRFLASLLPQSDAPCALAAFYVLFIYFLCSQYILTASFPYNLGFYGLLLPSFLIACWRTPDIYRRLPRSVGTYGLLAFFLYIFLHAAIVAHTGSDVRTFYYTLCTGLFVAMALACFHPRAAVYGEVALRSLMLTAAVTAFLSLVVYAWQGEYGRLIPIGRAHNPIPGSSLQAIGALIALWYGCRRDMTLRFRLVCLLSVVIIGIMLYFAQSRGPILAFLAACMVALFVLRQWRLLSILLAAGLALVADYAYFGLHGHSMLGLDGLHHCAGELFEARNSFRLPIWQKALHLTLEQPFLGHGLHARFSLKGAEGAVNPHNLFLGTAYYTGLPGLLLLLLPLGAALITSLRQRRDPYHALCLVLLVHGIAAVMTNFGQPVKSPFPLWTIYWLPIAMALARPVQKASVGQAYSPGSPSVASTI